MKAGEQWSLLCVIVTNKHIKKIALAMILLSSCLAYIARFIRVY